MTGRRLPQLIDFVTPSEEAISLHEAGHACAALVVGVTPAFVEFVDDPASLGMARNRIPLGDQWQRRMIACAAYAVEYNLYRAGRLADASGNLIDQTTFLQLAVANNAAADKVNFFGEDREQPNGCWPAADDQAFMHAGHLLAADLPMKCVFALAEAMLRERRLECDRIVEIAAQYLPTHLAAAWKCP